MLFGKIEYLNLLPFHVFMKRFTQNSSASMAMNHYKGVPSKINHKFSSRKVDAAFISSVGARDYKNVDLGIIAKKEVLSVLVVPSSDSISDTESATSNILAKVLKINGKVLIGDKALHYYLEGKPHVDLAREWNNRYNLPFVFAILCYHKDKKLYRKIQKEFLKAKVKIPQYILKASAKKTDIKEKDILKYLEYISYEMDYKAKKGVKKFYTKAF